jgi:hypothetical protein
VNYCRVHVGRLVEVRAEAGYRSVAEVDAIFAEIGQQIAKVSESEKLVFVVDWRRCPLMSREAAERMLPAITSTNPRAVRSATIASKQSPTAVMQFLRLVRESKHPDRRLFYDVTEVERWLGEILTPPEAGRLHDFLAYREPKPSTPSRP